MEVRLCLKSFIFYYPIGYRSNSGGHTETFYFPIKLFITVAVHKAWGNCQHRQSVKYKIHPCVTYFVCIIILCVIVLVNTNNVQHNGVQCWVIRVRLPKHPAGPHWLHSIFIDQTSRAGGSPGQALYQTVSHHNLNLLWLVLARSLSQSLSLPPVRDGDYLDQNLPSQGGQQRCCQEAGGGSQQSHVRPGFSGEFPHQARGNAFTAV